jgi:DNA-binding IclR family transcriptional regulator
MMVAKARTGALARATAAEVTTVGRRPARAVDGDGDGEAKGSQTVAAIERAADILLYFTQVDQADLGITDIAGGVGVSKAAVHRVLASLRSRGLIDLNEVTRRYSLGPAAVVLGLSALDRIDIRKLAVEEMRRLTAETDETTTLSVRSGPSRIYLDQVTPDRPVIMTVTVGKPYPLHAGSSSKAFLAFMSDAQIEDYLSGSLEHLTPLTLTDKDQLRTEIDLIRQRGWADSAGERQSGAASVAAPVFDATSGAIAVISVCGPVERFEPEKDLCVEKLLAATSRLSARMGYRG